MSQHAPDANPNSNKEYVDNFITELKGSMDEYLEENQPKQPTKESRTAKLSLPDYALHDVRKEISNAALENCADLEWDMQSCLKNGSWLDKFVQCSQQSEAFWNCIRQQKDKLKELGYMNMGNTDKLNQEIQDRAFLTIDSEVKE
ncbi:hypothetical protein K493DRAFT_351052 [Basidiobolus meristosporus CBS 931.73]|uniref:COX assembly mitochondrial protein n=1 Tax=Basidiobolus meristosporus CBS 931.73 TaxID=1314790 RepID=A0A1Y1YEH5_9FUNG|nr:hypothetical protein K493DRAFT_351052 [Basidiobolus meristosporus CBS 931.73]|eukprot:ORX96096.1 hypothetical protein K493DRAFT_351052 [Basidiobolus meristosporus CBS 931.73]